MITVANRLLRERFSGESYVAHGSLMAGDRAEDEECARLAGLDFQWAADWRSQAATEVA